MILLDTNVLSELMRPAPDPAVLGWMALQKAAALYVTALSCAEILAGIALLPDGRRRQRLADLADGMFRGDFAGRILAFDQTAASAYAAIIAERSRAGKRINAIDAMIAAIARVNGAMIASRDNDLSGCSVPVVNPWVAAAC
jgi:predicted nucleic acid-binding protein